MNKTDLASVLSKKVNLKKREAENIINELFNIIIDSVAEGKTVNIAGFGSFSSKYRSARAGVDPRNPKQRINIPATTVAKFKAGSRLKNALKK